MSGIFPNAFRGKCHNTSILHSLLAQCCAICSLYVFLLMHYEGLENLWLMDSIRSWQITRNNRWFSHINPMTRKEYIWVNESFVLKDVAMFLKLHFNLHFKKVSPCILD